MRFDLQNYETVDSRLDKFWTEHPNGRVETRLLSDPLQLDEVVVWAAVWFDVSEPEPRATGLAFERRGGGGANQTSHLENAETSAIGRALANANYKTSKNAPRPSQEEMRKANGNGSAPRENAPSAPRSAPQAAPERWDAPTAPKQGNAYAYETGAKQATPPKQEPEDLQLSGGGPAPLVCTVGGCGTHLTKGQHDISVRAYGQPMCPGCQKKHVRAS
jgi:hypothetical protein